MKCVSRIRNSYNTDAAHMSIQDYAFAEPTNTLSYRQTLFHFADGKNSETLNLNEKCKLRKLTVVAAFSVANCECIKAR